jgi:radical SAM superfamily enzyme YgiQ (UPF0313 family)
VRPHDFSLPVADFIVLGEGERTFPELIDALELRRGCETVRGLAISRDGQLFFTEERPLILPSEFPVPNRNLTRRHRHKYFRGTWRPIASIIGSRGCSFRCTFCCQWVLNRGKYRVRETDALVRELTTIPEPYIDFIDDNSWENSAWVEELHSKIQKAGIRKSYKIYARSDLVVKRPDLVERWAGIGLKAVLIGFESFRDEDLVKINKKNTVSKNVEAARILKNNDVETIGYFMIDPSYQKEDFLRLADHVRQMEIDQPIFSVITPFPGTRLYEEQKGRIMTVNYDFYDGMHALSPTALPPEEFYDRLRDLYRKLYPKKELLRRLLRGSIGFSFSQAWDQMSYLRQLGPVA